MPCLNEAWAGVYLQVIATILVFALGVPLVVEQISVPEDLRRIIYRHRRPVRWLFLSVVGVTLVALGFIWVARLHPTESGTEIQDQIISAQQNGLVAAALVTSVAIVPVLLILLCRKLYSRDGLLHHLKRKCARHIRRWGTPHESTLEDIQYLGERGKAGHEKRSVLELLDELARQVQRHRGYTGNNLSGTIRAIEGTLREGANAENFLYDGIPALKRIIGRLQDADLSSHPDMGFVMRALRRLGRTAIEVDFLGPPDLASDILDAVAFAGQGPNGSLAMAGGAFFTLGSEVLKHGRFPVAVAALNKIEVLRDECIKAERENPDRERLIAELLADYYGLVAHFWAAGPTARDRVRMSLQSVKDEPLEERLRQAREHHASNARFDTADKLVAMIEDVRAGRVNI